MKKINLLLLILVCFIAINAGEKEDTFSPEVSSPSSSSSTSSSESLELKDVPAEDRILIQTLWIYSQRIIIIDRAIKKNIINFKNALNLLNEIVTWADKNKQKELKLDAKELITAIKIKHQ